MKKKQVEVKADIKGRCQLFCTRNRRNLDRCATEIRRKSKMDTIKTNHQTCDFHRIWSSFLEISNINFKISKPEILRSPQGLKFVGLGEGLINRKEKRTWSVCICGMACRRHGTIVGISLKKL